MKTYAIYINTNDEDCLSNARYIKESFVLSAAVFNVFWGLYNKLWFFSAVIFLLLLILGQLKVMNMLNTDLVDTILVIIYLYIGYTASDLQQNKLRQDGYILKDIVRADNLYEAQYKFLANELLPDQTE